MIVYENVRSDTRPLDRETDEASVWVNENIHEVTSFDGERMEFEFTQKRYTKDEYIKLIDERNDLLEAELTATQLALCEVYEMIGGQ